MNRQGASAIGLKKRIRELELQRVLDPREACKVRIPLAKMLMALVAGMVTQARSLRGVERRTEQMKCAGGGLMGLSKRIADNTFGKILPRLEVWSLMGCLHRLIKAENRRRNLQPTQLPFGAAAIDGKNVGTVHWPELCRMFELQPQTVDVKQLKARLAERYPEAQCCVPEKGLPYALVRMHTVTLISSEAAPCIHMRPIAGNTNEIGSMPDLLSELKAAYGKTRLFTLLTTDAGNTSLESATQTRAMGCDYFGQIKSSIPSLYQEASRVLDSLNDAQANATYADQQNGKTVTYHGWHYDLGTTGWLDWTHARQLIRVQRITEHALTGKVTVGNRYYVCSRPIDRLSPQHALTLSRCHWRCENETHWTCDAELLEDKRRLAWSRNPRGILVVAALRMMALAILAIARRLTRFDYTKETPSWAQVAEHFLLVLCAPTLMTQAFDHV